MALMGSVKVFFLLHFLAVAFRQQLATDLKLLGSVFHVLPEPFVGNHRPTNASGPRTASPPPSSHPVAVLLAKEAFSPMNYNSRFI